MDTRSVRSHLILGDNVASLRSLLFLIVLPLTAFLSTAAPRAEAQNSAPQPAAPPVTFTDEQDQQNMIRAI